MEVGLFAIGMARTADLERIGNSKGFLRQRLVWRGSTLRSALDQELGRRSTATLGLVTRRSKGHGRTARGDVGGMPRVKAAWGEAILGSGVLLLAMPMGMVLSSGNMG